MSEESRVSSEWLVIIGVSLKGSPRSPGQWQLCCKEGWVQVDPSMPEVLWDIEGEVDNGTSTDSARCSQAILSTLWCFVHRTGMCVDAGRESSGILVPTVEDSWEELPHTRSGISSSGSCTKDLEALFVWAKVWYLHRSQEPQGHIHSVGVKHETTKMTRIDQRLWAGDSLSPRKGKCGGGCSE